VNMGEASADERWAKYAFQKEGVVQFPPTANALNILLGRCGIDVDLFGTGRYRTLHDFWLNLTSKESNLEMSHGQPLQLADSTVVRLRWKKRNSSKFQVLVKEYKDGRRKLLSREMASWQTWEESALMCLEDDLGLKDGQAKTMLATRSGDKSAYTFMEEVTMSDVYPGIRCLYRTHLVSYVIKESEGKLISTRTQVSEASSPTDSDSLSASGSSSLNTARHLVQTSKSWSRSQLLSRQLASISSSHGLSSSSSNTENTGPSQAPLAFLRRSSSNHNFVWLPESEDMRDVKGASLWQKAKSQQERHRLSSVLLGLEGSAPQKKSPFGVEHDGSGKSAPISALGNSKWSAYRYSSALQVPADQGGLRMLITKEMFNDLVNICEKLNLLDPSQDLVRESHDSLPREILDQKHAESELFKRILTSNAEEAGKVVQWMYNYRMACSSSGNVG